MSTIPSGPTSLLDAVNTLLASLGEAPVTTLDGPLTADVSLALNTLNEVSREVQNEGWVCNTENGYTLPPNTRGDIAVLEALVHAINRDASERYILVLLPGDLKI